MNILKKAFQETIWFVKYNWIATLASLVVAAIFGTVLVDFPIARWKENTMIEFSTYLVAATLFTIATIYIANILKFATVDAYGLTMKKIGIAKITMSPHTGSGICNSYGDRWCCFSVQNMDWDIPITQSHCRVEKVWRVGDKSSVFKLPQTAKASWKGKKPISEQTKHFYADTKPREKAIWYIACLDEENELVVIDTSEGILKSLSPGTYNLDIVVGGEFAGKGMKQRKFKGRIEYKGGSDFKFWKR